VTDSTSRRPAIFLDRDGTLIEDPGYLADPDGVVLLPGAAAGLRSLRELGFALAVVSNRSGIARGLITQEQADAVHERFVAAFRAEGVELDDVRYCPHGPDDGCACRKPLPGLILDAADALGADLARSFVIGDKDVDVDAGRSAGCRTIAFGVADADYTATDWGDAVAYVRGATVAVA